MRHGQYTDLSYTEIVKLVQKISIIVYDYKSSVYDKILCKIK